MRASGEGPALQDDPGGLAAGGGVVAVEIGLAVAPADILSLSPLPLLAAATAHRRSPLPIDGGAPPLPLLAPHCRLRLDQIINGIALAFVVFEVLVGILTVLRFVQAQRF